MIFILILFFIICLYGIRLNKNAEHDPLDKKQTNAIRGIFAFIIFLSHFGSYALIKNGIGDGTYTKIIMTIGQMMVAPFLFYSGYGVFVSSKIKGEAYIKSFPKKRLLKTYIFFASAVLLYLIANLITFKVYDTKTILLSFVGYESIGNSNWFMFAILFLYFSTFISALITNKIISGKTIFLITFFTLLYVTSFGLFLKRGEYWWYDTVLCYPFGMLVGLYSDKFRLALKKRYFLSLLVLSAIFGGLFSMHQAITGGLVYALRYNALSCAFCLLISTFCGRFVIQNRILQFLGTYGFEIYILQRLPDSLLAPYLSSDPIIFFLASFSITLIISVLFNKAIGHITRKANIS